MKLFPRRMTACFAAFLFLLLAVGCQGPGPLPVWRSTQAAPESTPAPTPTSRLAPIFDSAGAEALTPLPRVVDQRPAPMEEAPVDGSFEIVFNQPMEPGKTAQAWQVTGPDGQAVQGEVTWPEVESASTGAKQVKAGANRVLRFSPASPLHPGAVYQARLEKGAASQAGAALPDALDFTFRTLGDLAVTQVSPSAGSLEVNGDALITVIFNHPVVPLLAVEDQGALPQPLQIDPAVAGKGEWINTSVYVFHPEKPLPGGVTYAAVVEAGLEDTLGGRLPEEVRWQFTTIAPTVESLELPRFFWQPPDGLEGVPLDSSFALTFRQPMDKESVAASFSVLSAQGKSREMVSEWNELSTRVVFTPTALLELGTAYSLHLGQSALSADGGSLREGVNWNFVTVLPPSILRFSASDGQTLPWFTESFQIDFASPVKYSSLAGKVIITPGPPEDTSGEGYKYYLYDKNLVFYGLQPSTTYEVRVLPGIEDLYGNPIQRSYTIRFTNGPMIPSAYLLMPQTPALLRLSSSQDFYLSHVNVRSVHLSLFSLSLQEFDMLQKGGINLPEFQPQTLARTWEFTSQAGRNQRARQRISLAEGEEGPLSPGIYFLGITSPEVEYHQLWLDARLLVVADANLTLKATASEALLWVTGLDSGAPMGGVRVRVYDENLREIGQGFTGVDGLAWLDGLEGPVAYAVAGRGDQAYGDGRSGEETFGLAYRGWESELALYDMGITTDYYTRPGEPRVYLYTDRPIYRPGQTMYFKGVARLDNDLRYSLPSQREIMVSIFSYDETVYTGTLPLSEMGTFEGELILDEGAALGEYRINAGMRQKEVSGGVSFTVAEYKKPEFRVGVRISPDNVRLGETISATVEAGFYSGGALAGAPVTWSLTAQRFFFSPPEEKSDLSRYNFLDYDRDEYFYFDPNAYTTQVIAQGEGVTGPDGRLHLDLPAEMAEAAGSSTKGSLSLTLEATVADLTGSQVSDRAQAVAHRSAFYPGIRSASQVGQAGEEQTLEIVVVDWEGNPAAGQKARVEVVERRWHSVQEEDNEGRLVWKTTVEDIPAARFESVEVDEAGKAQVRFTPLNGGVYRARVSVRDSRGQESSASTYLWVAGEEYVPWRPSGNHSFELVPDRDAYTPGDTAEILIASPFQGEAVALVTVERGSVIQHEVIRLEKNSTLYRLPITPEFAPNVYVSALVIQGSGEGALPDFKLGVASLQVSRNEQELQVEVAPDRTEAGPGEAVTYTVRTLDASGQPVSAEVSLALVDQSVLSLTGPNSLAALDYFYPRRWLGVLTAVPLTMSIEQFNAGLAEQESRLPAGSGGGKGGGQMGVVDVREDFTDTAYWAARLLTDENGMASVSIRLPDNLTTWRMDARAVTPDTRVGQAVSELLTTKPLLVRPQTPRFFVEGDRAWLSAAIHNNTGQDLVVEAALDARGVTLEAPAPQTISIPAGTQAQAGWWASVDPGSERVDLVFGAAGGGLSDASRPTLATLEGGGIPVYRYEALETVGTAGSLSAEGLRSEAVGLPLFTGAPVTQGELVVRLDPSLAAGMADGLTYLEHYPYECTEQTVSRFLPNVVTTRALREAGVSDSELEANLAFQVSTALQRLYNGQHADGGWGWWGEGKSDPQVSAYVVLGLLEAQRSGYPVSPDVLERGVTFLKVNLQPVRSLQEQSELNRQAFLLYVLARAGQPDPNRNGRLFDARQGLSLYAQAYLAQAIHSVDEEDPRLKTLAADFTSRAGLSASGAHWEEKEARDAWNWNTDLRTTAIVLEALLQIDPNNSLNENVVRWLMSNRTQGHWGSTQETAWTLMVLTDWAVLRGEFQSAYQYEARLNDAVLGGGMVDAANLRDGQELHIGLESLLSEGLNRLDIARSAGPGSLYYTAHLSLSLPVEQIAALSRGITLRRDYFPLGRREQGVEPVAQSALGDTFLARLTIVAPHDLHYLVVEDPLPAGLEAVDRSLKTSQQFYAEEGGILGPLSNLWAPDPWGTESWGWWYFDHVELRDEKVVLSASHLPAGTYEYTYLVRAAVPGEYRVMPPTAYEFYFPDVYGRGEGKIFIVNSGQ